MTSQEKQIIINYIKRTMIHFFKNSIATIKLPDKFTYPFHYTPHPLCIIATKEVQAYLTSQSQWQKELQQGKMFGVLIVQTPENKIGYLAAFSGTLAGKNCHPFFVPPIYDLLQPQGFFKIEEERISAINVCIKKTQNDPRYIDLLRQIEKETIQSQQELTEAKEFFKSAKKNREIRRKTGIPDAKELAAMIRESQFQKAELKRMEKIWKEKIASLQAEADTFITKIETMKTERKKRSATLQRKLFEQFQILNAHGETKDLCRIFAQTIQKFPPAGAGECAAPKLLQYAYKHQLKPIAMAEFWWGDSPKAEIRHHGYYYPACKGKCGPILGHMLQGLEVEENPLLKKHYHEMPLEIVYEDNYLVVINKPAGMLSVPGKGEIDSVYQYIKILYPDATGPLIVHRLDMATSGVLLIAKNKEVHQHLQAQWNKQDSIRLQELLNGDGELKINTEAVKSIHFDFQSDKDNIKGTPIMSEDKPWMKFLKDLPKNFGDTTKWVRPNFVRLTPYTPYTTWHEDPVNDPIFLKRKDSLTISWKLNIKLIPGLRNGYVILPAGMDQTVTPSNNPLIGGLDADKFLYESLTKRGRAIRRNRNRAKGWKIYQSYVPTRQDSILFPRISKVSEQDSLPKQDTLLIKKDSAIINQNSLLLKDKINGKDQTEKSR